LEAGTGLIFRGDKKGLEESLYHIPIEFRTMINGEYDRRIKRYNKLLGKT
jgi:hypothetical protein